MPQPPTNTTLPSLPTPAGSVVDILEANLPGYLQEALTQPRRLPTLESWSTYGENCRASYYHIAKAEEQDIWRALSLLLINSNLYSVEMPYEHGMYDFDVLTSEGRQSYYKPHTTRALPAEEMRETFRRFLKANLEDHEQSYALDGEPMEEAHFMAANPLVQETILGGWGVINQWNRQEYFIETEQSWVYWFFWLSA